MTCSGIVLDLYGGGAGTDQWLDHSVHGNDGTLSDIKMRKRLANNLEVIQSDGIDEYVTCGQDGSMNIVTDKVTILCWAKAATLFSAMPDAANILVFGVYTKCYLRGTGASNDWMFTITDTGDTQHTCNSDLQIQPGRWYLLAGTYDGTTQILYVNGEAQSDTEVWGSTIKSYARDTNIGGYATANSFNGEVWRPRLLTYPLSQPQIGEIYNQEEPWFR